MQYTYIASSNTATNGAQLGADNQDVVVKKILIGLPVSAGNIVVYDKYNPIGGASTNIAAKVTLPTFSTTNVNPGLYVLDFTSGDGKGGLQLGEGGNVTIDQTMQVTVVWDLA